MKLPTLILGAGGHGRVLAETLLATGAGVIGFLDADKSRHNLQVSGRPVLGGEDLLAEYPPLNAFIAIGVGSTSSTEKRRALYERILSQGYEIPVIQHPSAIVSPSATLAEGVQLMAGCIVQGGVTVGANAICNTGAIIDHDCEIGAHSHIATGAVLSGTVKVGEGCHIGAGAVVIQGISIGPGTLIGAGAVVIRDIPAGARVAGVPAKDIQEYP